MDLGGALEVETWWVCRDALVGETSFIDTDGLCLLLDRGDTAGVKAEVSLDKTGLSTKWDKIKGVTGGRRSKLHGKGS